MSALAWLFGLGALAIAFPFLLHLIRRTPRGQTEFSSLMFLKPSPPTLTRRSRLENILLLLMRAAAILLIAAAFMRPFFRGADTLSDVDVAKRRVVILLDTSASMRRADLWEQATQQVEKILGGLEQGDDVALLTFDNSVKPVVPFDERIQQGQINQANLIRDELKTLEPTWASSDLGQAMVSVADRLDVWRDSQRANDGKVSAKLQIVVVSDLQKGSKIESLQAFQWPAHVYVQFLSVVPDDYSNATVQLLDAVAEEDDPSLRIRVVNSEESKLEQFFVNWPGEAKPQFTDPISFYVPPGTSRVLKIPPDDAVSARQFVVSGDQEDFDNTFYVVPTEQQKLDLVYVGKDDQDDPEKPHFYLRRALVETPSRLVTVRQISDSDKITNSVTDKPPTLVVLASPVDENQHREIDAYLNGGGTLFIALTDLATTESTAAWTGANVADDLVEGDEQDAQEKYLMLAEINFASPLFQPFANPRYNDFTKIRFWKHQAVELPDQVEVIARFDNHDPAIWKREVSGGGQVFVFASGWHPDQSQLALSTKFVPLINGLVEIAADVPELNKSLLVGDSIEFPALENGVGTRSMIKPDGTAEVIDSDQTRFTDTNQPGIYRLVSRTVGQDRTGSENSQSQIAFAVNVDRAESETAAIPIEQLEMFEVKVGEQETASSELAQMRTTMDRDIENRQKFWKWLIVAAIFFLIGETWLAGQTASRAIVNQRLSGEMN